MKYIIGNWKSNKNLSEVHGWLASFTGQNLDVFRNHLILADVFGSLGVTGKEAQTVLDEVGVTLNMNAIADDTRKPLDIECMFCMRSIVARL
jgi:glycine/serine hydroxymethyltransferase